MSRWILELQPRRGYYRLSVKRKRISVVKPKTVARPAQMATPVLPGAAPLLSDLRELILSARQQVAQAAQFRPDDALLAYRESHSKEHPE